MIVHTPLSRSAPPADPADPTSLAHHEAHSPRDGDPFRQLFHRHANHLNSAQTLHMKAGLRTRLFAEKNEL